jgi:predicted nucleic acid-binding protein
MADGRQERVIYLDSNPIIYLVEGEPVISDPLKPLFEALRNKPQTAVTSELTLAEVLAPARRKDALSPHQATYVRRASRLEPFHSAHSGEPQSAF